MIPRRLNFICRRFGTLYSMFTGGVGRKNTVTPRMEMEQSVPKRPQIKFRRRESPKCKNTIKNVLLADIYQLKLPSCPLDTGWTLQGSNPGGCKRYSVLHAHPDLTCGALFNICPGASSRERHGQPRPSSAEVKHESWYTLTPSLWHVMQ